MSKIKALFLILSAVLLLCSTERSVAQQIDSTTVVEGWLDYDQAPRMYVIASLNAKGITSGSSGNLFINTTGLVVGDSIELPGDRLSSAARRLMDQRHFKNVDALTAFRGDSVDITFVFDERLRVRNWTFEGTKGSEAKDMQSILKLRRSGELSDFAIMSALQGIKNFYDGKGFRSAEVDVRIEADSVLRNYVNVIFEVDRKKKVRVKEIQIEGNTKLEDKAVVRSMKETKKLGINFFADTKYDPAKVESDKEAIAAYYRSKGYRDARVVADSTYMLEDNRIGLWLKVDEGKRYNYGDITWIGNSKIPTAFLNQILGLKSGDVYDSETMGNRIGTIVESMGQQSIASLYRDDGYLAYVIEPKEIVRGDTVDVEIVMIEGKQFTINEVTFEGNTRTNDLVVRRELNTRPGELYSQSLLMRSYQRLATMGQFDPESFSTPNINPNFQNETVDIGYSLAEISKDQFELSGGWGSGMFIASVGVSFANVSIKNFFKKGAWKPYPAGDNQTLSLSFQSNGTYYTAGSISFTEPWLGGYKATSLSVSAYLSRQTDAYYYYMTPTGSFQTVGVSVGLGKRIEWPDPYFQVSAGVSYQTYLLDNWSSFLVTDGDCNLFTINLAFGRNSIDDPTGYPTRGSEFMLNLGITPPWSLFDGKDYSDTSMSDEDRYQWVEYYKVNFLGRWFQPLTPDNKLVLMARAQFGYLGAYNKDKPSPFEGFQVGGDGLTTYSIYGVETIGLRGYENEALTPLSDYGVYASVYSKFTAELRYPVIRSGGTMVYGLVFAEAGNAFTSNEQFKPFSLKRSAGVGLRVYLPILGMLGIDWGYGFDPVSTDLTSPSGSQFHFTMGMTM
ncbi:MAG: POTRA domain-containing protein [Rikenellaceae bacterium]